MHGFVRMIFMATRKTLTGSELRFAAENQIPVFYEEKYHSPEDRHMNFRGKCVMEKAPSGFYIGNADIDPDDYSDNQSVEGEFPEGIFRVSAIAGARYSSANASDHGHLPAKKGVE